MLKYWPGRLKFPSNTQGLVLRIVSIVGVYLVLDWWLMHVFKIPVSGYYDALIAIGIFKQFLSLKYLLTLVPAMLLVALAKNRLIADWKIYQKGHWIRLLVFLTAALLTWVYATYDYNLYFNQSHIADRLILVVLMFLIWWRPVFVFPFLTILISIIYQFTILPGFSWAAPLPLIRIIEIFGAFFIVYAITDNAEVSDFVIIACSAFVCHYWVPGTGKLSSWWLLYDQVQYLLPATYANGWLSFLDKHTISQLTETIALFNLPIKILTLVIECGVLFFFWHRRVCLGLVVGCFFFQLGIFLVSGINFWMWMLINVILFVLFIRKDAFGSMALFTPESKIISALLILGSPFIFKPVQLAWLDVPLSYTYKFEATDIQDRKYMLPPAFFAPYDYQFTLSAFRYTVDSRVLPVVWGVTGVQELAEWLRHQPPPEEVLAYEQTHGKNFYDSAAADQLVSFLKKTIATWNERLSKETVLSSLRAPRLLWTFPENPDFKNYEPVRKIEIIQVTSYFYQGKYLEIRSRPVKQIEVP